MCGGSRRGCQRSSLPSSLEELEGSSAGAAWMGWGPLVLRRAGLGSRACIVAGVRVMEGRTRAGDRVVALVLYLDVCKD